MGFLDSLTTYAGSWSEVSRDKLSASEIKIAIAVLKKKLKGQELYDEIGYSMTQSKRLRKKILEKLNMTPHS